MDFSIIFDRFLGGKLRWSRQSFGGDGDGDGTAGNNTTAGGMSAAVTMYRTGGDTALSSTAIVCCM